MNEKVVYFSLYSERKTNFYTYIKEQSICYEPKFLFALEGEKDEFHDPRDLITLIERTPKKESLHIIIDYVSLCGTGEEINYSTVIRDIIMCYPEVQFLFDETFVRKESNSKYNFMNFLFWKSNDTQSKVLADFHQFDLGDFQKETVEEQFIRLLKGCNNMYDASNLRYAIKHYKRGELGVSQNYEKLQESRYKHVAVVVEEEYHQSMFNSYSLYANGFRVFPVISATELLWINRKIKEENNIMEMPLLIRDYDLQFVDVNRTKSGVKTGVNVLITGKKLNEVDCIRGAKDTGGKYVLIAKSATWTTSDDNPLIELKDKDDKRIDNPYWSAFDDKMVYFVSKGGQNIKVSSDFTEQPMKANGRNLELRGLEKPIEGIYVSMGKGIDVVKERYDESRDEKNDFETSRTGDSGHSCPLDIYGIARPMVHRAEDYYQNGRYRLAALVAGEALEILNGFHRSLMNKAYYTQAVSENAMAMSLIGGDEAKLCEDIRFRLDQKVKKDIKRMIPDEDGRYNMLYNIYNDCMLFCQKKEYFDAADEALSIMVIEKDGWNYKACWESIKSWAIKKFKRGKEKNNN